MQFLNSKPKVFEVRMFKVSKCKLNRNWILLTFVEDTASKPNVKFIDSENFYIDLTVRQTFE